MVYHISFIVVSLLIIVIPLLISVAYFTLVERKFMGSMQRRRGPNVVGFMGLLQPLADGLKKLIVVINSMLDNKVINLNFVRF